MDGVEECRLAGAVVAQQKEMPAIGDVDSRGAEIVELHEANCRDAVGVRDFHYKPSSCAFGDGEIGSASCAVW